MAESGDDNLDNDELDDEALEKLAWHMLKYPEQYNNLRVDDPRMEMILWRLRELLDKELSRRPAHRPRSLDSSGQLVANLVEVARVPVEEAKALAAEQFGLKFSTVDRAYRLYRQKKRGDK